MDDSFWSRQLTEILETIPAAVLLHNHEGRIMFANPEAARLLGHSQAALIGRDYRDPRWKVTAPDGRLFRTEERVVSRVLATGEPVYGFEAAIERPDGTRVLIRINGAPFRNSAGKVTAVITSFTEIIPPPALNFAGSVSPAIGHKRF